MTSELRVGVIGAGYWGRNLLRNFHALGALRALCESNAARREAAAGAYPGVEVYADAGDLLAGTVVDAVAIATPAASHGALAGAALAAGKHVFVEKPLCLDIAEGEHLARRAERDGRVLMVGHLLLYHPAFVALRETVAAGRLGALRYVYSHRLSLGRIRREENALWSFAPHDISMILALAEAMPERVFAAGGAYLSPAVADTTISHLTFAGGLQAHLFVSWLHPYKDHRLVAVGADGMAVFDDVLSGAEKLRLYRHLVEWSDDLPAVNRAPAEPIAYDRAEPLRRECAHFLDCVEHGHAPLSDAAEGLRVLAVLDACQRALLCGEPVSLHRRAA